MLTVDPTLALELSKRLLAFSPCGGSGAGGWGGRGTYPRNPCPWAARLTEARQGGRLTRGHRPCGRSAVSREKGPRRHRARPPGSSQPRGSRWPSVPPGLSPGSRGATRAWSVLRCRLVASCEMTARCWPVCTGRAVRASGGAAGDSPVQSRRCWSQQCRLWALGPPGKGACLQREFWGAVPRGGSGAEERPARAEGHWGEPSCECTRAASWFGDVL